MNNSQLLFEESLLGPPLVANFVAKVFWKFFRVEGLLRIDIIHVKFEMRVSRLKVSARTTSSAPPMNPMPPFPVCHLTSEGLSQHLSPAVTFSDNQTGTPSTPGCSALLVPTLRWQLASSLRWRSI